MSLRKDRLTVPGLQHLVKFAELTAGVVAPRTIRVAITYYLKVFQGVVQPYPESDSANEQPPRPKRGAKGRRSWYKRDWGPRWLSKKKFRWKPERLKRRVVYGGNWAGVRLSQQLSKKWGIVVASSPLSGRLGNRSTYAPPVHGTRQAEAMGARGWKNIVEVELDLATRGTLLRALTDALAAMARSAKQGG